MALLDGLWGYWKFEESSGTRYDASGMGHDAVIYDFPAKPAPGRAAAKIGYGVLYSYPTSRLQVYHGEIWAAGTAFTFAGWFIYSDPGLPYAVEELVMTVVFGTSYLVDFALHIFAKPTPNLARLLFSLTPTSPLIEVDNFTLTYDTPHFIAIVIEDVTASLYVDNVLVGSVTTIDPIGPVMYNYMLFDGEGTTGQTGTKIYDEFIVWKAAKTPAELTALWNNGAGINFLNTMGTSCNTLAYAVDLTSGRDGWMYDKYTPSIITHYGEEGSGVHDTLCGSATGNIYQLTGESDDGVAIPCAVRTPALDQGDPRFHKLYGDILLDCDTNSTNLTVIPSTDNFVTAGLTTVVNNATRTKVPISLNATGWVSGRNVGLDISWDTLNTKPLLYAWEPRFTEESAKVLAYSWETCWITHELPGYFYHGYLYVVHVSTADLTFYILNPDSTAAATVTIPNSGGTLYSKSFIRLPVVKGNIFKYKISSTAQFRLSGEESELLVKPWGMGGEWKHEKIFQDVPQGAPAEQVEGVE
jgi:hypothetical protein